MRFLPTVDKQPLLLALLILTCIASCKKGDTGPAGATGAAGPAGTVGAPGPTGTANVTYSPWMVATGFKDSMIDGSSMKIAHLKADAITTAIQNSGTVLVYINLGAVSFALPYSSNAGGKASTISYAFRTGDITITRWTHDGSNSTPLSTLINYRFIIIPGGTATNSADEYRKMSYEEVIAKFALPVY